MANDRTNIGWTDSSWNPVTGCSKVSAGCKNCYAAKLAPRLAGMGQKGYTKLPWTKKNAPENVFLHFNRLDKPLRWKKPRRVFVNSMSDLFHEQVPDEFIDRVFAVMALASQHAFQVLTKRTERMAEYLGSPARHLIVAEEAWDMADHKTGGHLLLKRSGPTLPAWPLPNAWLGTSVEDQRAADERIPHLLRTPASVRFLSCEPLIGPVDLVLATAPFDPAVCEPGKRPVVGTMLDGIEWVIAGGESGPGFRPLSLDWARSLRDQCVAAGVPYFFKQSSGLRPEQNALLDGEEWRQFPGEG